MDGADFYRANDEMGHIHLDGDLHLALSPVLASALIILPAINLMACGPEKVFEQSGPLIMTAIDSLMRRAVESGDLRDDVSGMDLLRTPAGLCAVAPTEDWPVGARKVVEILLLGARPA
ncbi:Transcriptional regulator, TetR family [Granulicella sibirica]|uniref:Transcriptional regulator, TetR family n=1 Tax=Granulicella sibirica TaxID=2479048 RepID=A0A4Q0T0A6_9BACT|nr:Transcriptional regulator, TetR family [Granulicella sibirica]